MAGHSKWAKIHRKKGLADAQRGKIFSRHSKLIAIAAKGGADADLNPILTLAIENAKKDNTPNANIEKAIRAGAGLDKDAAQFEEILYEGYAPGGVAILVQVLTDNKNRAAAEIRHVFSKYNGSLGTPGSVAYRFKKKGEIIFQTKSKNEDEIMDNVINAGATDLDYDQETTTIYCDPSDLHTVRGKLRDQGFEIESAKIIWYPQGTVVINDTDTAHKIMKIVEAFDELEDVDEITANFDIPDEILAQLT